MTRPIRVQAAAWLVAAAAALIWTPFSHQMEPAAAATARMEVRGAGPYVLDIALNTGAPPVQRPVEITVRALAGTPSLGDAAITVLGRPGAGTDATPTRVRRLRANPRDPGTYTGEISFAVSGAWILDIRVSGPAGIGAVQVPITAAAPPAIPVWAGWTIGLSPLLGIAWFGWWNLNYLRRLRAEGL